MHWGVRRSKAQLLEKADKHEKTSAIHAHLANEYGKQHQEIQQKGIYSKAFKTVYGDHAPLQNEGIFRLSNGRGKAQALEEVNQTIQSLHNSHARSANRHSKKAAKLRALAATAEHTGFIDEDDFLEHFGVKGMHWGVRRDSSGGGGSGGASHISPDAARAHASATAARKHGTSALSNAGSSASGRPVATRTAIRPAECKGRLVKVRRSQKRFSSAQESRRLSPTQRSTQPREQSTSSSWQSGVSRKGVIGVAKARLSSKETTWARLRGGT